MKRSYQDKHGPVRRKTYPLMALLVALALWACDQSGPKPTGPTPSGKAAATQDAPPAPTNLRVEAVTNSSARVLWDAVEGATDYKVTYKPAVGGQWTNLPKGTKLYTLYTTITNLEPNTAYRWGVSAYNNDDPSSWVLGPNFTTLLEEAEQGFEEGLVSIPDANLRAAIAKALGFASGATITPDDMAALTSLEAPNKNISDLTGLEFAINLTWLDLGGEWVNDDYKQSNAITDLSPLEGLTNLTGLGLSANTITDLSPLEGLTNLTTLDLWDNAITDLSPLEGLTNLTGLGLSANTITDLSPLSGLTNLTWLGLSANTITDLSPLLGLTNLTWLVLGGNAIWDLSPLEGLTNLTTLDLGWNAITDISPLLGLTNLTDLYLWENPLSSTSINTHIPAFESRGVFVEYDSGSGKRIASDAPSSRQSRMNSPLFRTALPKIRMVR